MSATVNDAVEANLERVLAEERFTSVIRLARVRMVVAFFATLLVWWPGAVYTESLRPTRYGSLGYLTVSALLVVVTSRWRGLGRWGGISVPLIDVPTVAAIQYFQQSALPAPWMSVATNVGVMCALVALSAFSLSRPVIVATAAMATVGLWLVTGRAGIPVQSVALASLMLIGIAAVGLGLVVRLRRLLHLARAKDLVGKYILGDRLGAGGMAEVFLATYSPEGGFERRVAVKRILPSYASSPESVALFRREAELSALLAHPNIVQVLDFGTDGTGYFMAMEFVEGLSLAKLYSFYRRISEPLPLPVVVHIAWMVAEALDHMHTRLSAAGVPLHLVHRDVNPPNVLLSRIGEVKLGDFGIARAAAQEGLTAAGTFRGKVGYSAPEHLLDQPYDSRADLFSLGVTLHELLHLQRLFPGDTEGSQWKACLEAPIPLPTIARPEMPPAFEMVVMGLLERDVRRRIASAREVIERLRVLPPELSDHALSTRLLRDLVSRAVAGPAAPFGSLVASGEGTGPTLSGTATAATVSPGGR